MNNIHVLPTDKPSRLSILNSGKLNFGAEIMSSSNSKSQHIYITNDEEIKEGDYYITPNNTVLKALGSMLINAEDYKKIILTTDQDLINDGVQSIDNEFLEWFVKNPSCEEVEVKKGKIKLNDDGQEYGFPDMSLYKIIIPKEEPKQKTNLNKMSNNKQTAVEWLIEQLEEKGDAWENASIRKVKISIDVTDYLDLKRQAKAMEKEQIIDAYNKGEFNDGFVAVEDYYNEIYGK